MAGPGARFAQRVREQLSLLSAPRPPWAGFDLDRPIVMGVLNVTPDSFSDGGQWFDTGRAVAHGRALLTAGAEIIDVGGELTRPGAGEIHPGEEILRVEPVVRALVESGAVVSIDTRHKAVMEAALDAGARIVNDVSALTHDAESAALIARRGASVVLMHMRGEPRTMQCDPVYNAPLIEVLEFLKATNRGLYCRRGSKRSYRHRPGHRFRKTRIPQLGAALRNWLRFMLSAAASCLACRANRRSPG